MKFRTRIWLLPASAACIFTLGLLVSLVAGNRTSSGLGTLREVDVPYLAGLTQVDRGAEQFRLTLQTAAAEGDVDKLKDVEAIVVSTQKALDAVSNIPGKATDVAALRSAFDAYQAAALGATRAMLNKGDIGDQVQKMQTSLTSLRKQLDQGIEGASREVQLSQEAAAAGVKRLLLLNLLTGMVVLGVLGGASWLTVKAVWRELGGEPDELRQAARRVADGDLSVTVHAHGRTSLAGAVSEMVDKLRNTVGSIRQSTDAIATAASEISMGNQDLSTRTETTAANLQQTASSMEELTTTVRHSADAAQQANQLSSAAAQAAQRGGEIVTQVVSNMDEINVASRKISEIIGVIDGIAFQTNILALNAAVEAARAGEQGRGFAVVASEVRTLAQRSALAAKEIKTLIGTSSEKVDNGSRLVQAAGSAMSDIVAGVKRVGDIIGEISTSTREQSTGIGHVNETVTQLDQMTQQNAALVEQSAAAADSLREQASNLAKAVMSFRLVDQQH